LRNTAAGADVQGESATNGKTIHKDVVDGLTLGGPGDPRLRPEVSTHEIEVVIIAGNLASPVTLAGANVEKSIVVRSLSVSAVVTGLIRKECKNGLGCSVTTAGAGLAGGYPKGGAAVDAGPDTGRLFTRTSSNERLAFAIFTSKAVAAAGIITAPWDTRRIGITDVSDRARRIFTAAVDAQVLFAANPTR